jgi:hypothetical protein
MIKIDWSWVLPILTALTLVAIILLACLLSVMIVTAQESLVFSCVVDADGLTLYDWGWYRTGTPISDSQWDEWLQFEGDNIWLGYPQGFDIREPVQPAYKIKGEQAEVWIWRGEQYYYVFPFADMTLGEDGNPHPCGAYRVDKVMIDGREELQ